MKALPETGDMVRVRIQKTAVFHYGIYVGDRRIVQFGTAKDARHADPNGVKVNIGMSDEWEHDPSFRVAVYPQNEKMYPKEEIARRALARVGEGGYDFVRNNCEHFVYECAFGVHAAPETEKFSEMFSALPKAAVYVCPYPFHFWGQTESIFPTERRREIENAHCGSVRKEKYYVWKLLEWALMDFGGLKMQDIGLFRSESGKWQAENIYLSLSHSKGLCAAALSDHPIGVDIEEFVPFRFGENLARHILTEEERKRCLLTESEKRQRFCAAAWTGKESTFKRWNGTVFVPNRIDGFTNVVTRRILYNGSDWTLSCSSEHVRHVRFVPLLGVQAADFET